MKKRITLFIATLIVGVISVWAQTVEVNGVFYSVSDNEATVVRPQDNSEYSGVVIIPDSIDASEVSVRGKLIVSGIRESAFSGMENLDSIGLPMTMNSIGWRAFANCENLKNVVLPDSLTQLEGFSFQNCSSISNVVIPDKLEGIDIGVFSNCLNLKSLTLGENVKEIGSEAFYGSPISEITCLGIIPPAVGYNAFTDERNEEWFHGCRLNVPEEAKHAYRENYFWGRFLNYLEVDGLKYTLDFKENTASLNGVIEEKRSEIRELVVPSTIPYDNIDFKVISVDGFESCASLEKVTLPETLITIGGFYNCINLKEIRLPQSLQVIKGRTFYGCSSLTSINLPVSLTKIGTESFYLCISLKEIECDMESPVGDASTFFGSPVFVGAELKLKNGDSDYINAPGWSRFFNCVAVDGIYYLLNYDKKTATATFEYSGGDINYKGISKMEIPAQITVDEETYTVNKIGEGFLSNVMYLSPAYSADLNSGRGIKLLEEEPDEIFVTDVILPATIQEIGEGAFSYCYVKNVSMQEGIMYIGDEAFADCDIEDVIIPNSVASLGKSSFSGCRYLKHVTLGSGLKTIEDYSFSNCYDVETVKILAVVPPAINDNVFDYDTYRSSVLYVPEEAYYDYKVADVWKQFKNLEGFSGVREMDKDDTISSGILVDVFNISGQTVATQVRLRELSSIVPSGVYVIRKGERAEKMIIK